MKLKEIAQRLGAELRGNGEIEVTRVIGIEQAGPGDLTFVANPKYLTHLKHCPASAVILAPDVSEVAIASLRSENPYLAFAKSIEFFYQKPSLPQGIHPTVVLSRSARIGCNPTIGAYVVIGDNVIIGNNAVVHPHVVIYSGAKIGDDVILHSRVVIREEVVLGNRVTIQNGAIIGGDGFGFARQNDGSYYKIVQAGTVVIEDDVEIGANTTIDRATVGTTQISRGAKLDNLVQIGHGSVVGQNSLLAAQVGLAGSSILGRNVMLAGQVGVAGHLTIGDNAVATAQTGIPASVEPNSLISGYPAIDNRLWRKASVAFTKLPELVRRVRKIEDAVFRSASPSDNNNADE